MSKLFRIGCADTKTGCLQAEFVAEHIKPSGYGTQIIPLNFPEDLDSALLNNTVDITVSLATTLPLEIADEIELIAFTKRLPVNDVVVGKGKNRSLREDNIRVATTSERILAFVRHYYPKAIAEYTTQTEKDQYDVWVMDHTEALFTRNEQPILEQIETSYFTPSAGQGSCVVKCHKKLSYPMKEVLQLWVNHEETEDCIRAERIFLNSILRAEHYIPFSYAHFEGALITLKAGLISKDGKEILKAKKSAALGGSRDLGKKVALEVMRLVNEQQLLVS
jgi:hydroxymethylbilane synthase